MVLKDGNIRRAKCFGNWDLIQNWLMDVQSHLLTKIIFKKKSRLQKSKICHGVILYRENVFH